MTRLALSVSLALTAAAAPTASGEALSLPRERQVTFAPHGHVLTNTAVWSPDGAWLVYDLRANPERFTGTRIERVNADTGRVEVLYEALAGSACGVVTWSPTELTVVFIQGPEPETADWTYGASRRRGVIVDARRPGVAHPLDAANYAPPFTPGALRGGSHVHVFSGDGRWVSFTYEDEVLDRLGPAGESHDPNQRNIGVAVPAGPVRVNRNHPRNHDGDWFAVVVSRTVASPRPGSDEINRAFEEGWIGVDGYRRVDGSWQRKALAFQGQVIAADGRAHAEVFVLDLPDDLTVAGDRPLAGTTTRRPAPPHGVGQRRLTFTEHRRYRGVQGPRHWLRSSPDGEWIAFLMKDDAGVAQFWLVSPRGGEPHQLTHGDEGVESTFTWSPDGRYLAAVMDGSVCLVSADTGKIRRLTPKRAACAAPLDLACVFSPDGRRIAYERPVATAEGTWAQIFVVGVPPS